MDTLNKTDITSDFVALEENGDRLMMGSCLRVIYMDPDGNMQEGMWQSTEKRDRLAAASGVRAGVEQLFRMRGGLAELISLQLLDEQAVEIPVAEPCSATILDIDLSDAERDELEDLNSALVERWASAFGELARQETGPRASLSNVVAFRPREQAPL